MRTVNKSTHLSAKLNVGDTNLHCFSYSFFWNEIINETFHLLVSLFVSHFPLLTFDFCPFFENEKDHYQRLITFCLLILRNSKIQEAGVRWICRALASWVIIYRHCHSISVIFVVPTPEKKSILHSFQRVCVRV